MRLTIKLRVLIVTLLLFSLGGAVLLYAVDTGYSRSLESAMEQTVADSQSQFAQLEKRDVDKLDAALAAVLSREDIVAAFRDKDRERLYGLCAPLYEQLHERNDITTFVFFEAPPTSTYFLRVQLPEQYGEPIERASYLQAVENGDLGYGIDLGKHLVALRAVRPVRDADGTILGYLEMGQEVPLYLSVLKEQTGDEFALLLSKEFVKEEDWIEMRERASQENDWADNAQWVVGGSTGEAIDQSARALDFGIGDVPESGKVITRIESNGRTVARGIFPVVDATGKPVAAILLEHDMTEMVDTLAAARTLIMIVLAVMFTVLIASMLLMLNSLVFKRLDGMVARLEESSLRFMGGDFSVSKSADAVANDEIGDFERFFARFLSTVAGAFKMMSGPK